MNINIYLFHLPMMAATESARRNRKGRCFLGQVFDRRATGPVDWALADRPIRQERGGQLRSLQRIRIHEHQRPFYSQRYFLFPPHHQHICDIHWPTGKTGDWKNHFSPELNTRIDQWIEANLKGTDLTFVTELDQQDWSSRRNFSTSHRFPHALLFSYDW